MADKKIIGKLENIITFSVNKASLNQALASIKRVKDAMKSAGVASDMTKQIRQAQQLGNVRKKQLSDEDRFQRKLATKREADQVRSMKFDRRAQATQEWFGTTFGRGGQRKATGLYNDLRAGKINAEQYSTRLRTLRGDLYRSQRAQRGFNQSIHDMRGAFVQATASYTAFAGVMGISNIGKQYEAQKAQMLVATGNKEQAESQLEYLRSETYRLGLGREQASQGYSQIAMAGQKDIGVGGVNKVFSGLSELATATKLEPFKYEKVVNAMAQMLSKQQIYSEELEL